MNVKPETAAVADPAASNQSLRCFIRCSTYCFGTGLWRVFITWKRVWFNYDVQRTVWTKWIDISSSDLQGRRTSQCGRSDTLVWIHDCPHCWWQLKWMETWNYMEVLKSPICFSLSFWLSTPQILCDKGRSVYKMQYITSRDGADSLVSSRPVVWLIQEASISSTQTGKCMSFHQSLAEMNAVTHSCSE